MPHVSGHIHPEWDTIRQAEFRDSLTQLNDSHDLATFWGVAPRQLNYYAFHVDKGRAYSTFSIPKRNGGQRAIKAPCRTLKYIQRLIHESLSRAYGPHPAVHGFRQGRSIVSNAKEHTGRQYVLHVDLEDFFPSITRKRIYGRLIALPYELKPKVANLIASLATDAYSRMPQGSPSSPVIANILAAELDTDLAKLCGSFHCTYTRYADDMERTLYNAVLAGVSLDGRDYFYVNRMETKEPIERKGWFNCSCCPPNVHRLLGSLQQYLYTVDDSGIQIHLYNTSAIETKTRQGQAISFSVRTDYPRTGNVEIAIGTEGH